ncbi:MAG: RNA polymerase sigma-54 factor [Rhizobiales bacterium NRL2]|jgi:RNA polymerase sigma-54 factor|nr:MAG: RNA polymerase sigma-54 factor [Rhizobiales bacterium NRL2]
MALSTRLELRQSQNLVMTPQLQQAIKLLQLNNIELSAFVEQELERNPLLDDTGPDTPEPDNRPESDSADAGGDGFGDEPLSEMLIDAEKGGGAEAESALDAGYDDVHGNDSPSDRLSETPSGGGDIGDSGGGSLGQIGGGGSHKFDDMDLSLENTLSNSESLRDHLTAQLNLAPASVEGRLIAAAIIDSVDEDGYFRENIEEMAERLGCSPEAVEDALALVQAFDPTGVAARDLAECLALQLRELDRYDPAMKALVGRLDLLARQDYPALLRECGVDEEDLTDMIRELKRLDPRPGRQFETEEAQTAIPDVLLRQKPDGGWQIELNPETLPRVLVNNRYYAEISAVTRKAQDKTYLTDCFNNANWLVKSLEQRANTIMKVATELVRQQDGFFAHGVQHLRPLNLRTIADAIGMHESTVSRVTSNKYIGTPRGIFEMKYFFTASIPATDGGESHSAEAVRHRIKDLIEVETPDAVLSDDRIVEILRADGVDIARRTVAKYREALRIPSSVQRRRMKRMQLDMAR